VKTQWFAVLALSTLIISCSTERTPPPAEENTSTATPPAETPAAETPSATTPPADAHEHGVAGAVPGSYEDWCGEHQVPESACTRCNPSLIPAFQATNDWCAEHGLPESQCLKCNPNLKITRPPKPQGT
jgi:hypothetical protein